MGRWTGDARMMGDVFVEDLRYPHDHVHILNKDGGPTKKQVLDTIASLNRNHSRTVAVGATDMLVLYYSGHGSVDGKGDFLFHTRDGNLSQSEMMDEITRLRVKYAVFIIDACHSAAFKPFVATMSIAVLAVARFDERVHKSFASSIREYVKVTISQGGSVQPYLVAQNIDEFLFNSYQWDQSSIGPVTIQVRSCTLFVARALVRTNAFAAVYTIQTRC